jgi:GMP synthase PP-ATPase subunit
MECFMTEEQIERTVERRMDMLDRRYLAGDIPEDMYVKLVEDLDDWAKEEYRKIGRVM